MEEAKRITVEQHLKNQIEKGAPWAERALSLMHQTTPPSKHFTCDSPKEALLMAFAWAETEKDGEGFVYWDNIYRQLPYTPA